MVLRQGGRDKMISTASRVLLKDLHPTSGPWHPEACAGPSQLCLHKKSELESYHPAGETDPVWLIGAPNLSFLTNIYFGGSLRTPENCYNYITPVNTAQATCFDHA